MIRTLEIINEDPQWSDKAALIFDTLKKTLKDATILLNPKTSTTSMKLIVGEALTLIDASNNKLSIDSKNNLKDYFRQPKGKSELLGRALGKGNSTVLDLTMGLGIDFIFISQMGFHVTGLERHPILHLLLRHAFPEKQSDILLADANEFLTQEIRNKTFDVIYFDPMYPSKKKSALPRQEMVLFRHLVGNDEDSVEVLKKSLQTFDYGTNFGTSFGTKRVVVKRPLKSEPLLTGVSGSIFGKLVRYDIYSKK